MLGINSPKKNQLNHFRGLADLNLKKKRILQVI